MGPALRACMWGMGGQVNLDPRGTQSHVRQERTGPTVLYGDSGRQTLLALLRLPDQQSGISSACL